MTQSDFGTIDPNTKNGTELATDLNGFRDAQNTQHRGASVPGYAQGGMIWIDESGAPTWVVKINDGTDDLTLFTLNIDDDTVALSFDTIALTDSGTLTSLSVIRSGTPPTVNMVFFEDLAAANNFSNVEIKAARPGLIFRDSTAVTDDFRLGLDGNVFKISIDGDQDDTRDSAGHFDDFPNAFVLDGANGNVGFGRIPTQPFDIGVSKSGADLRMLLENIGTAASSITTLHLKGNSSTSTGKQIIAFNGGTSGFTIGWDEAGEGGDGFFRLSPSSDQDITDSDGGLYMNDSGNVGIGFIGTGRAGNIGSQLHVAVQNNNVQFIMETLDPSVAIDQPISQIQTAGGEAGGGAFVGQIRVEADEAWDATSSGTRMTFFTALNGTLTAVETMRLDNGGKLTANSFEVSAGLITSASGAISFGNEDLTTTGTITSGPLTLDNGNADGADLTFKSSGNPDAIIDNNNALRFIYSGALEMSINASAVTIATNDLVVTAGKASIGTASSSGQLHVDQAAAAGAIPVLVLDQGDVSEEMIEFITTIGTGNAIEAIAAKTLTTTHFVKVTIPGGLTRYLPVGTIA